MAETDLLDAQALEYLATGHAFAPHPSFAGVSLARLADEAATAGRFASFLVRLEPGAAMRPHRHATQVEQHLVLAGSGRLDLAGEVRDYRPGSLAVIAQGAEHGVVAGPRGMRLLAVFSPAQP